MADEKPNGADVEVTTPLGGGKLRNIKDLNTPATVATLIGVCLLVYMVYAHAAASGEMVSAMREMAQAQREGNCINSYPEMERAKNIELCKVRSR